MNLFEETKWMEEKIYKLPKRNMLYKIICFFLFKKLTYKEAYMILYHINKKNFQNENECKIIIIKYLINLFNFNKKNI